MILDFLLSPLFLTGFIFCIVGFILYKFPPKEINSLYGYRTNKSMDSQEKWDFAQRYSAALLIKTGIIFCILSSLKLLIKIPEVIILGEGFVILIGAILLIILTEKAIKNKFRK